MEFSLKNTPAERVRSACVIVGLYEDDTFSPSAKAIDDASSGYLGSLLQRGDLSGRRGQCVLLHSVPSVAAARVLA